MRAFPVVAGITPVPLAAGTKNNVHSKRSFYIDYYTVYQGRLLHFQ
jgi:hypothetical protein